MKYPKEISGNPGDEVVWCPVCGEVLFQEPPPSVAKESLLDRALRREPLSVRHMENKHPVRYWLWLRFKWNRLLGMSG